MNYIKLTRKRLGYTLKEVAEKANISEGYLCHLENGSKGNPSKKVMEAIANALHTKASQLFNF